ncbi:hypothetical protein SEEGA711_18980, partial [Salmonella enterica subsp. enterica serovar Gaminara str. ATCC BAA-711]
LTFYITLPNFVIYSDKKLATMTAVSVETVSNE